MTKLWGGRFDDAPAAELLAFTESLSFDVALVHDDCAVLAAHAAGLARAGLLTGDEAAQASSALEQVAADVAAGSIPTEPTDEDVHTLVERLLLTRLPDVAPKLRAGLSRNDRVAAALRRWLLREGDATVLALVGLVETIAARAGGARDVVMPGYTHLQRAQPVTLAHHLLGHAFALVRDGQRLRDALARADASPLGAGALAGSTLGIDPAPAAADLGFGGVMANSLDAVSARDFVAEFCAAGAICGVHLSRIGEELVLWTSSEFGFARLADAYATGSSLMPQKKNPDVAELARGKAGRLIGNLAGLLATLKGLPLAYNRDLQEDKEPLFDTVRTLRLTIAALDGALASLEVDAGAMARAADDPALLATDLAEHLVAKGVPFREAHEIVGAAVKAGAMTADALRAHDERFGDDVASALDARASVARRVAPGPGEASIDAQLAEIARALADLGAR